MKNDTYYEKFDKALADDNFSEVEKLADAMYRHSWLEDKEYIQHFCKICRRFAYVTADLSLGELEKEIAIMSSKCAYLGALVKALDNNNEKEITEMLTKIKDRWGKN